LRGPRPVRTRHGQRLTVRLAPVEDARLLPQCRFVRENALFYRTLHGAEVGDLFMTLTHTCQLCGANSFDYLTELQLHARELMANPAEWMPWNYRQALEPPGV
jgi:hypothetical protein